ncbi:Radical SAM protein [Gammaproteobacteria bacterium]
MGVKQKQIIEYYKKFLRLQKVITVIKGPMYSLTTPFLEIDITYACNLRCLNCNRSCRQAPTNDSMTAEQIRKFISESVRHSVKWERIRVLGGEPTLHPDISEILRLLFEYKQGYSPAMRLQLVTNGFGDRVREVLSKVPEDIEIENTKKTSPRNDFRPFNKAPRDSLLYLFADYTNGCWIPPRCGIGLTPYGYYTCAVAGAIDRILGYDLGVKEYSSFEKTFVEQRNKFCGYCGIFRDYLEGVNETRDEKISRSWQQVYRCFRTTPPKLTQY